MARRPIDTFSLSFLDCICCGFGAVILLFILIVHRVSETADAATAEVRADASRQEMRVEVLAPVLADATAVLSGLDAEAARLDSELARLAARLAAAKPQAKPPPTRKPLEKRRRASGQVHEVQLMGLRMDGRRSMILVDSSASMLDSKIVGVVRRRHLPSAEKRRAPKWRGAVAAVDWIAEHLPSGGEFQIYTFDVEAQPLIEGSAGRWLDAGDASVLEQSRKELRKVVPRGGTSLHAAVRAVAAMRPRPDSLYILTDGLPTQGSRKSGAPTVTGQRAHGVLQRRDPRAAARCRGQRHSLPAGGRPGSRQRVLGSRDRDPGIAAEPLRGLAVMKRRRKREIETASLSFLDCICCGFGAIVLLLVITKIREPTLQVEASGRMATDVVRLREQERDMLEKLEEARAERQAREAEIARKRARINELRGRVTSLKPEPDTPEEPSAPLPVVDPEAVIGLPADSEYVIFVLDTSGSMKRLNWELAMRKISEVLDVYPVVRGFQVLNDMGEHMFTSSKGTWLPDTQAGRARIREYLRSWNASSNSSPVEGITAALSTYYGPDKSISIYVFGDEFTGQSIQEVVDSVDRLNRPDARGNRLARIHAIGFPLIQPGSRELYKTGRRFALLMRVLCERNGGTFIGLNPM